MREPNWIDVGSAEELASQPLRRITAGNQHYALSFREGRFGVVSNACNHVGGPLGEGHLDGDYVTCPWHAWKFHRCTGEGEPGFEDDAVPALPVRVEGGRVLIDVANPTKRNRKPHAPHPLAREVVRGAGAAAPRRHFDDGDGCGQSAFLRLRSSARTCAGGGTRAGRGNAVAQAQRSQVPCLRRVLLEGRASLHLAVLDHADGPERRTRPRLRGAGTLGRCHHRRDADPLGRGVIAYFKMAERLNCIQNAITIGNHVLIRNKVAGFIIVGGQDNIQAVAGQMLGFFAELGFIFPQFPFIAHSRGWSHEDMERNVEIVRDSARAGGGSGRIGRTLSGTRRALAGEDRGSGCDRTRRPQGSSAVGPVMFKPGWSATMSPTRPLPGCRR